jgi:glucose-1-phosphate thymidylyltransferase
MKGIILAGGHGTRLYPITKIISKQLLPVYNKPMIYYPLSTLMLAGIQDILIISTPKDLHNYKELLGNGQQYGIKLSYLEQSSPRGLAEAFIIGESFIGTDDVCLILGDNIFYGKNLPSILKNTVLEVRNSKYSKIFAYYVNKPERYGVIEIDENNKPISIEEKPANPKGNHAVVGLYFYKNDVIQAAKDVTPSLRGELEITSINHDYLVKNRLKVELLDSIFWLDTGTHDALVEASSFIKTIELREGKRISCLEEIAYKYNYIDSKRLKEIIDMNNENSNYLKKILKEK